MEDRTRRILVGLVFAAGAIAVSASTAGAQSGSSSNSPTPKTSAPFDDSPASGSSDGSMPGGCSGMHMPDDASTGTAAQLT